MATKKRIRADNTYIISQDSTENPKLGAKILSNGKESLFLDYYFGYQMVYNEKLGKKVARKDRRREFLRLYLKQVPRTPFDRQENKETLALAKKIRFERGQELLEDTEGYRLKKKKRDIDFLDYFQSYIDSYTKKDIRMLNVALRRFVDFLSETKMYKKYANKIKPEQITHDMMVAFAEYLQTKSIGTGAKSIYARFKKVVKYAIEHDVMKENPCAGIIIMVDEHQLKKDVLSPDEVQQLIATHYDKENPTIRRAFIFCLYCGLRYCDVKDLTFANVDYSNKLLKFEQNKTKGHSANSSVVIPLNDGLLKLLGDPAGIDNRDALIFPLPSYDMCRKALKEWVKCTGINKHISWHCARHTFAVNILNNGANIKTVASLLGHSGLKHTEKYTRAIDSLKKAAINSLPELEF
ncbi:MAG: site-specific integrase [Parabacteroides sp.]|nr:site-specific integrase [Parabacteroides sp.]MDY5637811.1 site-specific integrase [Parabacteroides sp.]